MNTNIYSQLVPDACRGVPGAMDELYRISSPGVYYTIHSMTDDPDDIADLMQDTYLRVLTRMHTLEEPASFQAWANRIATNLTINFLARRSPVLFREPEDADGEDPEISDPSEVWLPDAALNQKDTEEIFQRMLGCLPTDQRLVVMLYYYQGLSIAQIAQQLRCPEGTVKSRLNYGKKKLEAQILDMEKQGIKLYSLPPFVFFIWVLRSAQAVQQVPDAGLAQAVYARVMGQLSAAAADRKYANAPQQKAPNPPAQKNPKPHGKKYLNGSGAAVRAGAGAAKKALAAKIAAGVLAVTLVGGGTGIMLARNASQPIPAAPPATEIAVTRPTGQEAQPVDETTAETQEPAQAIPENSQLAAAYQGVCDRYIEVCNADSKTFLDTVYVHPDRYFHGNYSVLSYWHSSHDFKWYTALTDIDGNGTQELLIGYGFEPETIRIIDLWGYNGMQAVQLLQEPTLGDRSSLTLNTDGTLRFIGSSGADNTVEICYRLSGTELTEVTPGDGTPRTDIPWQELAVRTPGYAYRRVVQLYFSAWYTPSNDWMNRLDYYNELFRDILYSDALFFHHMMGNDPSGVYYALADIDGNGTQELFIGSDSNGSICVNDVYAWNGYNALPILGQLDTVLQDGLILSCGNGGGVEETYRLGPDGFSLIPVEEGFQRGEFPSDAGISAHGGQIALNWQPLIFDSGAELPSRASAFLGYYQMGDIRLEIRQAYFDPAQLEIQMETSVGSACTVYFSYLVEGNLLRAFFLNGEVYEDAFLLNSDGTLTALEYQFGTEGTYSRIS